MEALGALAILVGFGLFVGGLVAVVWTLVHAASHSGEQFRAAGQNRLAWLALVIGGFLLPPTGMLVALVYLVVARPRVNRAARAGGPQTAGGWPSA